MKARYYLAGFLLLMLAILALVIQGRFSDCLRSTTFNPNSIHANEQEIREFCARRMFLFSPLYR